MTNLTHWFRYQVGDMEFELRYCSALAEGIAHRLMRAYWRRGDRSISTAETNLAKLAKVPLEDFRNVRHELEDVVDMTGSVLRIRILDSLAEQALKTSRARSRAGIKGAEKRYGRDFAETEDPNHA